MTLASQLYDSGHIKTISSPILDTSIYEEIESYESNGTTDDYSVIYIDITNSIKHMKNTDKIIYMEFILYIYYLGEIPEDILEILDSFIMDPSIKNFINKDAFNISLNQIENDVLRLEKFLTRFGNGLLFVGWYKIKLNRKMPLTAVFLKQEEQ